MIYYHIDKENEKEMHYSSPFPASRNEEGIRGTTYSPGI